jgi:predicted alpha/beta-fold hydrolase
MRGADFSGEDIFHGGTTEDLRAALSAPDIARYRRILLLGYSVGGHIVLRAAIDEVDPRVQAAAAICPPLDLDAATVAFDHPSRRPYRRPIFRDLNRAYRAAAARGRVHVAPSRVERARSSRERDSLTVVVRFGFRGIEEYYEHESVAPRLHRLRVPALVVANVHDPIVPPETLTPALRNASSKLSTIWTDRGGHVYFPSNLHLRQPAPLGLESQVIHWLGSHR